MCESAFVPSMTQSFLKNDIGIDNKLHLNVFSKKMAELNAFEKENAIPRIHVVIKQKQREHDHIWQRGKQ